jgi:ATP-dependent Lon protease
MGTDMTDQATHAIPVLPLRDVVVYPHMVIPLFVGREKSINALDTAMQEDKKILLVAQKNAEIDDPDIEDIHEIGTLSTILQLLKLPDGTVKVLVEGAERVRITGYENTDAFFTANIIPMAPEVQGDEKELDVLTRSLLAIFDQYVKLNKKVPPEILTSLSGIDEAGRLADTIAAHMSLKLDEKQKILEIDNAKVRIERLMVLIEGEIDIMQIEKRIRGRVKQQMEKSQREYYLNEQMKAIQKELGDMEDTPNELEDLEQKINKAGMSQGKGDFRTEQVEDDVTDVRRSDCCPQLYRLAGQCPVEKTLQNP